MLNVNRSLNQRLRTLHMAVVGQRCLSPPPLLSICLSVYLSICLSVYLPIFLSIYPSICPAGYLSICLSVPSSIRLSIRRSIWPSIHISAHPFILPPVIFSVYPSICPSVTPFLMTLYNKVLILEDWNCTESTINHYRVEKMNVWS